MKGIFLITSLIGIFLYSFIPVKTSSYSPNTNICSPLSDSLNGKKLFLQNCSSCHSIEKKIVGPALGDIHKRRKKRWTKQFIKNGYLMVEKGDKTALRVYKEYKNVMHPNFEFLSDKQIEDILLYIKTHSNDKNIP